MGASCLVVGHSLDENNPTGSSRGDQTLYSAIYSLLCVHMSDSRAFPREWVAASTISCL